MSLIRTVSIALVLGLAVATTTTPASAFFFHKHKAVAAEMTKHPIHGFFCAIFHCKK
jgi:hypothetical protein